MEIKQRVVTRLPEGRYMETISGDHEGERWRVICHGVIGGGRSHHEYEIMARGSIEEAVLEHVVPSLTFGLGL